jgi:hypothetical protein
VTVSPDRVFYSPARVRPNSASLARTSRTLAPKLALASDNACEPVSASDADESHEDATEVDESVPVLTSGDH